MMRTLTAALLAMLLLVGASPAGSQDGPAPPDSMTVGGEQLVIRSAYLGFGDYTPHPDDIIVVHVVGADHQPVAIWSSEPSVDAVFIGTLGVNARAQIHQTLGTYLAARELVCVTVARKPSFTGSYVYGSGYQKCAGDDFHSQKITGYLDWSRSLGDWDWVTRDSYTSPWVSSKRVFAQLSWRCRADDREKWRTWVRGEVRWWEDDRLRSTIWGIEDAEKIGNCR